MFSRPPPLPRPVPSLVNKLFIACACLLALAACRPGIPEKPRNLVVICLDTVRYDSFMERGVEDELTPWLEQAQHYSNATSTSPWTLPAVASLLTGLYPVEHGAGSFSAAIANLDTEVPSSLGAEVVTLGEIMLRHYWRTGAFVSHPFFRGDLGLRQGFQIIHNRRGWWRDVERMWVWADRIKPPDRFFGYLHFMEAHHRHTQSNPELEEFLADIEPAARKRLESLYPENCADPASRRCRQSLVYEVAVIELRRGVASVLSDLEERSILDDTLVVVYSDHGEEFWDHEEIQLQRGTDPRRNIGLGHGQNMYQELLRVPLLVWHPRLEGAQYAQPVSLIDVVPSVLRWMEIEEPDLVVSGQLLPPLYYDWFGEAGERVIHASNIAYGPEQVASRQADVKAIFTVDSGDYEIYDLASDPGERQPLDDPGLLLGMETLAGDYLELPPLATGAQGELESGQLEDLKAIGYLQGVEEDEATVEADLEDAAVDDQDGP